MVLQKQWEISRLYGMFATPIAYLVDERGREYVVLLDAQGIVRGVTPQPAVRGGAIRQGDASGALFRLRFAAGNRPRRLLVRFE